MVNNYWFVRLDEDAAPKFCEVKSKLAEFMV